MGQRYYITGVQIGMLKGIVTSFPNKKHSEVLDNPSRENDVLKILEEVQEKQYLCEAEELNKLISQKEE